MDKCFYHYKDLDGLCSGAIIKHIYPECKMIGVDYGEKFPWEEVLPNDNVVMVDFSLDPFQLMHDLQKKCKTFLWIDHHKSAIDKNGRHALQNVHISTEMAACELVWKDFFLSPTPDGVRLIGLYDIWKHEDPRVLPYHYGLESEIQGVEDALWGDIFFDEQGHVQKTCDLGSKIMQYQQKRDRWNMKFSFVSEFEGLKFICVNNTYTSSTQFNSIWDSKKYDAMMVFFFTGEQWSIHMYTNKPNINLVNIATKYGGGGHVQACGFQSKTLPVSEVKGIKND
jgi:oligoribonuclease NrnB/cAMP/cGMP phosphodiesterase (DHH superfamily)